MGRVWLLGRTLWKLRGKCRESRCAGPGMDFYAMGSEAHLLSPGVSEHALCTFASRPGGEKWEEETGFQPLSPAVLFFPICRFCNVPHSSAPFSLSCPWSHCQPAAISCCSVPRPLSMYVLGACSVFRGGSYRPDPSTLRRPLPCLSGGLSPGCKAFSAKFEQV